MVLQKGCDVAGGLAVLLERVENAPWKAGIVDLDGCSRRRGATRGLKIADYRRLKPPQPRYRRFRKDSRDR
jgi:hypothetical protein